MTASLLARTLQEFLASARDAVVIEDGQALFDLAASQYSISCEKDRCLLHLWSEERNMVRHVMDAEQKNGSLTLTVRRFAQARVVKLEICCDRDRRPATVQRAVRTRYARLLERVLRRPMPDWQLEKSRLSTTHLPMQGLDYWARVLWHHSRGEFQEYGYFGGAQLSPRPPLLFLVAPSLRV